MVPYASPTVVLQVLALEAALARHLVRHHILLERPGGRMHRYGRCHGVR